MQKNNKANIEKSVLYIFVIAAIAYIIFTTAHMLWDIAIAKELAIKSGITISETQKIEDFVFLIKRQWMFQYISTMLLLMTFLLFVILGVKKMEWGYLFIIIWNAVWIGFLIAPIILYKKFGVFDGFNLAIVFSIIVGMFLFHKNIQKSKLILRSNMRSKNYLKI
ncbi:putative transmembrane protein [Spiroplasma clarkii]|uniref:Uncharacterized protein n=1 Tax=Spiroplasma clarkii TaxID=2139 RepID=A0A1Y0L0V1_9MOLU|nr:hypothetical protein [Spiroplasma clarkii]ARU91365.1 putative transmembrane protein [Spiroplasma clarkii]ATX70783.1 hypothetical protein SCLAR_v1c04590 [Spiroplasma clarkii]